MRLGLRLSIGMLAVAGFTFANLAAAAITGSKHDMTGLTGQANATTEVCKYCHVPHNPQAAVPLWNRGTPGSTYTVYANPASIDATIGQPGASSKMCMSCHDGSIAIDSYGGLTTGTKNISTVGTGKGMLGTDLSNDHPIGFAYTGTLATADGWLNTPVSANAVDAAGLVPLFATNVECASCHAVHDTTNAPFLRMSNASSNLCKKCHTK